MGAEATPWVTLIVGLAASPVLSAIFNAIRDRLAARGRIRSECDRAKVWAWDLLEHAHELRVMLIRGGTPESELPPVPASPFDQRKGQKNEQ